MGLHAFFFHLITIENLFEDLHSMNYINKECVDAKECTALYHIAVTYCSPLDAWLEITHPIAEEEIDFLCCAISKHIAQQIVVIRKTDFNLVGKCH